LKHLFFLSLISILILGCKDRDKPQHHGTRYAVWFDFKKTPEATELEIYSSEKISSKFYLVRDQAKPIAIPEGYVKVQVPVKNIVCSSTTQIPWLEYLDAVHLLTAFPNTGLIYSKSVRQRIDSGNVVDIGKAGGFDYELLSTLGTDILLSNPYNDPSKLRFLLKEKGSALMFTREFEEQHPLGRAEWILLMGLLLDRFEMADSVFNAVEFSYKQAKNSFMREENRPSVFTGIPYSGVWHVPAGNNFLARLFDDAGYHYVWSELEGTGTVPVGFESVFEKAYKADFWIGAGDVQNLSTLILTDNRFGEFKSVSKQNVFVYDQSSLPSGGNGYFEFAGMRPDLLLTDLVKIRTGSHPDGMTFYRRLR